MRERAGKVLLASDNEWFTEALTAVLGTHLYGVEIDVARDREEISASVLRRRPNLVIVDDRLSREHGTAALCREMVNERLDAAVPVLLYSSGGSNPALEAEALGAGAWGVLQEPLRSEVLTANVDRFLAVEATMRRRRVASCIDEETGLFELPCLLEALPVMTSLARRRRSPMSCTVVGPTRPSGDVPAEEQRRRTARVCVENVRASDLRGWADGGDVAIVAFDARAEGVEVLVERLNALIRRKHAEERAYPLSAGIVELESGAEADRPTAEGERPEAEAGRRGPDRVAAGLEPAEALAAARSALAEARAAGGGIRVAAVA